MKNILAAALLAAGLSAAPASAATLIVNGDGLLTGATGVNVDGDLYDVEFVDGSCAEVFGTCDTSSFTFQTEAGAVAAATALSDQVLLDGPLGNFDTVLTATFGCATNLTNCAFVVPYTVRPVGAIQQLDNARFINRPGRDAFSQLPLNANFSTNNESVWARFSPAVAVPGAVPEPGTWAMLLFGFGAIGGMLRRRRKQPLLRLA